MGATERSLLRSDNDGAKRSLARQQRASISDAETPGAVGMLLHLQRTVGNHAVNEILRRGSLEVPGKGEPAEQEERETPTISRASSGFASGYTSRTERRSYPFSVKIRRTPPARPDAVGDTVPRSRTAPAGWALGSVGDRDAEPGGEEPGVDASILTAGSDAAAAGPPVPELEEGGSVSLPDIAATSATSLEESDSVNSTLTYNGNVSQGGAEPDGFGVTRPFTTMSMSNIKVTKGSGSFAASATIDNSITFQVRAAKGPSGQLDVPSPADPVVTKDNFATVVSDLTPNMSDLKGRPPRTQFWAKDLTIIHENFHATERKQHAQEGVQLAQNQINAGTASSEDDVKGLLGRAVDIVIATSQAAMTMPGKEERAYTDGAPLYQARADAVRNRFSMGDFPTPDPNAPTQVA